MSYVIGRSYSSVGRSFSAPRSPGICCSVRSSVWPSASSAEWLPQPSSATAFQIHSTKTHSSTTPTGAHIVSVDVLALITPVVGAVVVGLRKDDLGDPRTLLDLDLVVDLQQPFAFPFVARIPDRGVEHTGVSHQ